MFVFDKNKRVNKGKKEEKHEVRQRVKNNLSVKGVNAFVGRFHITAGSVVSQALLRGVILPTKTGL